MPEAYLLLAIQPFWKYFCSLLCFNFLPYSKYWLLPPKNQHDNSLRQAHLLWVLCDRVTCQPSLFQALFINFMLILPFILKIFDLTIFIFKYSLEYLTVGSSIEHTNNMNWEGDMIFLLSSILEHAMHVYPSLYYRCTAEIKKNTFPLWECRLQNRGGNIISTCQLHSNTYSYTY